jgi:hypothetical protein
MEDDDGKKSLFSRYSRFRFGVEYGWGKIISDKA